MAILTSVPPAASVETPADAAALAVLRDAQRAGELVHLEHIPGQDGQPTSWPDSIRPEVAAALAASGVTAPWTHQAAAAAHARDGRSVIIATRAASGKSAGYLAAALSEILDGGTVLYVAPTKALAADQLQAVRRAEHPGGARYLLRRRFDNRGQGMGASACQLPADEPRHAAQRHAAQPQPLARLLQAAAGGHRRRVPRLPRGVRVARRAGPATAAPRRRAPRRRPRVRARLGDDRRSRGLRTAADRPGRRGGHRGRRAARTAHLRAVGSTPRRHHGGGRPARGDGQGPRCRRSPSSGPAAAPKQSP